MYGPTVLTYCSLLYLKGYKAFTKIEPGMHKFMDEHGYKTLADMRGIALKYIVTPKRGGLHPHAAGIRPGEVQRLRVLRRAGALRVHRDHRQEGRIGQTQGMLLLRRLLLPLPAGCPPYEEGAYRGDPGWRGEYRVMRALDYQYGSMAVIFHHHRYNIHILWPKFNLTHKIILHILPP